MDEIEWCGCGCGSVILPHDPDPFFKGPQCQRLWLWSINLPEGEQATRRAEMRFFHELWVCEPWHRQVDFYDHVSVAGLRGVANGILQDVDLDFRLFGVDEEENWMRVVVYRWNEIRQARGEYRRPTQLLPEWALLSQETGTYWRDRLGARAAVLAVSG